MKTKRAIFQLPIMTSQALFSDDRLAWLRGTPMQTEYGNGGVPLVIVWAQFGHAK